MGQQPKPLFGARATLKGAATIQLALLIYFALLVIFGTVGAKDISTPVVTLALLSILTWASACLVLVLLGVLGLKRVLWINRATQAKQVASLGVRDYEIEAMSHHHKSRFTIGQMMALIAAFAVVLGASRFTPLQASLAIRVLGLSAVLFIGTYALIRVLAGIRCPRCGEGTLKRLALPSRGYRYFRCGTCGTRYKRVGFGPWLDASGPEDEAVFRRKTDMGTWKGATTPDVDETTCGSLLGSKRRRNLPAMMKAIVKKPWRARVIPLEEPPVEETTCEKLLQNKRLRKTP